MAWLRKGLCGIDLQKQTIGIGVIYIILAVIAFIGGFIFIEWPEKFLGPQGRQLKVEVENELQNELDSATSSKVADDLAEGAISSEERQNYNDMIRKITNEGLEVVIGSLITITFSIMLIIGAKKSSSIWMLPWLIQQVIEMSIGIGLFIIQLFSNISLTILDSIMFLCFVAGNGYLVFSVLSYYVRVKEMSKTNSQVVNSVMEGESYSASGVNYQRLQEEVDKEMDTVTISIPERPGERSTRRQTTNNETAFFNFDD